MQSQTTYDPQSEYLASIGTGTANSKNDLNSAPEAMDILTKLDSKIQAYTSAFGGTGWNRVFYRPFDGEKSLGGIGPINKYWLDHDSLRLRSWQLMLESEVVQIGVQRYVMWLVGSGLKLCCEPDSDFLKKNGIKIDTQKFCSEVESLWRMYSHDAISDAAGMETLHAKMYEAEINALAGGDCLFIVNISDDGVPVCEIKDGGHVRTPMFGTYNGIQTTNPKTGNIIRHGIEIDAKGQHVAFYVRKGNNYANTLADEMNYERIPARDEVTGVIRAFMYYGLRYRLDDIRGIPLIAVCMETTKQLEMYKEATVTGAVEKAKIALVVEHELNASGTNPFDSTLMKGSGGIASDIPADSMGQPFQNQVAGTTNRQAINLAPGGKLVTIEGKQEIHFGEFYDTNLSVIFAALGIPKEIALMLFGSNYSASRASIKDWEHTLNVKRIKNVSPAYNNIYKIWFITHVMLNLIDAPGYLDALIKYKNGFGIKYFYIIKAYILCEWLGDDPPNIDELKEVTAARLKAGEGSKHLPLDTFGNIIKGIGIRSSFRHTLQEYQSDLQYADELGIEKVEERGMTIEDFDSDDEDEPKKKDKKVKPKGVTIKYIMSK